MQNENETQGKGKDKMIEIIVNGTPYEVPKKEELSFEEVVTFAYPDFPQNPGATYSVTYTKGHNDKEGILAPGTSVKAKDGMVFRVNRTSQS